MPMRRARPKKVRTTELPSSGQNASGISVSGRVVGDGVSIYFNTVDDIYGDRFVYSGVPTLPIQVVRDCRISATLNIERMTGGAFGRLTAHLIVGDGISGVYAFAGEDAEWDEAAGFAPGYMHSIALGPVLVPAGALLSTFINGSEDVQHAVLGAVWETDGVYAPPSS